MPRDDNTGLIVAVGIGLLLLSGAAFGSRAAASAPSVAGYALDADGNIALDDNGNPIPLDAAGDIIPTDAGGNVIVPPTSTPTSASVDAQLAALMATIRKYESGNNYNILYGNTINTYGMSDHPYFLGWPGVNFSGGHTAAAGAYQFQPGTWRDFQTAGSDFSPASQDAAALALLTHLGAVDALQAGDVPGAFKAASQSQGWASMPYSTSGQPKASLPAVLAAFQGFGGVVS